MTEQWAEQFMRALGKKLKEDAGDAELQQNEQTGLWYVQSFLQLFPELDINVLMQTMVFEARTGVPQAEIIFVITNDVKPGTEEELEKAIAELNYISPIGSFGLRRGSGSLYLRDCLPFFDWEEADLGRLVQQTEVYYTMMMEALGGGYEGLMKLWTGELLYEQTVEQGLLNRAPH